MTSEQVETARFMLTHGFQTESSKISCNVHEVEIPERKININLSDNPL